MSTLSVEFITPQAFHNTNESDVVNEKQDPMNWICLQQFHLNPPLGPLPREDTIVCNYQKDMALIKKRTTIVEYLLNKYLSGPQPFVLVPNDYPYHCNKDILHYLLWVHPSFKVHSDTEVKCVISLKLHELDMKHQDFIFFENYASNKSIPEITHYHVFIHL